MRIARRAERARWAARTGNRSVFRWLGGTQRAFVAGLAALVALFGLLSPPESEAAVPAGFTETAIGGTWSEAVGMQFTADGKLFVWERGGRVWIVENGVKSGAPFLDLSEEVGGWRDFGLLGFALHPDFLTNGYVYLYYVVDRHHLMNFGTASYNPATNEYYQATQGRITRYTAIKGSPSDPDFSGATTVDYGTRFVLHGDGIGEGCPILYESHGTGHIVFGADNTLLAACGDGASYSTTDVGSIGHTYYAQAIADGIMRPEENVGAYRSQMLSSLSGKIVRLDPLTGLGVSSNPYFESGDPGSTRSKVWALGLRNPYRMVLKPGTGVHDPAAGDPGTLYIGDVGWGTWEDLQVSNAPGQNFGWPTFEGLTNHNGYTASSPQNPDAPNPLYDGSTCTPEFFLFTDLLQQATLDPSARFPNPCDAGVDVPAATPTFFHARPKLDMRHGVTGGARWGSFDGFNAIVVDVGTAQDPMGKSVPGPVFGSNTSTAGVFYTGTTFPSQYQGKYFHAEWDHEWIKVFDMDANDEPVAIEDFVDNGGGIVFVSMDPTNGDLYYISWTATVWRVRYLGTGNAPPNAVASLDLNYGASPLTVSFTGDQSTDPEELPLSYSWNFGDGNTSTLANPQHSFTNPGGTALMRTVTLTVTDDGGANPDEQDQTTLNVWIDNDAPVVNITSPVDGTLYSVTQSEIYPLTANITDSDPGTPGPSCEWLVFLHHNDHFHQDPPVTDCTSSVEIAPVACDPNATYYWRVQLTATDGHGLATTEEVFLYPNEANCPNIAPIALADVVSAPLGLTTAIDVLANDFDSNGSLDPGSVAIVSGPSDGSIASIDPGTGAISYQAAVSPAGLDSFTYTVDDDEGDASNVATVNVTTLNTPPTVQITSPLDGDLFTEGLPVALAANADDAEDVATLVVDWAIDRIENGSVVADVFTHTGATPPAWVVPTFGSPEDHISYRVTVTVTDAAGDQAAAEAWLYPSSQPTNLPPVVACSATPETGAPPLAVDFAASGTWDPDGDLIRYAWDFGDGDTATGSDVQHVYSNPGIWHAVLTVTDALGATNSHAVVIDNWLGGVQGEYFDDIALTDPPTLVRVDSTIDFDFGNGSPDPSIPNDDYSIRWTGSIVPVYSEDYTFYISIDDGGRLWVDDILVIDSWVDQGETEHPSAPISMSAGVPVGFRFEWYENGGSARARLRWSSASQTKGAIPASGLAGGAAPNAPPIATSDIGGYARGGSTQISALANDTDDGASLDPASLVLGTPLHGSASFDSGTGVVTYTHDGSATAADWFGYSVSDTQGLPSNTTSILLNLSPSCGDGVVSGPEACDDGNTADGDCCSAGCAFETVGSTCEDGSFCTVSESCDGAGACVAGAPLVCDDGAFCNGAESCDPGSGCLAGTPPPTDDGVACTTDACDEQNDVVTNTPDHGSCDDALFCNGAESCDTLAGCQPGSPPVIDDGVGCTIDACDEGVDTVTHVPDDAVCDDLLFCTGAEYCDVVSDCQAGTPPVVNDGFACTIDSCDEQGDVVVHAPDDLQCGDGLQCTADRCDEFLGCVSERIPGCTPVPTTGSWGRTVLIGLYLVGGAAIIGLRRKERS